MILLAFIPAFLCLWIAKSANQNCGENKYNTVIWFILGFCFGLISLSVLAILAFKNGDI